MSARIMRPVLQPENIYAHPHQEQDVILWYNRALWHSIVRFYPYRFRMTVIVNVFVRRRNSPNPMAPG